MLWILLFIFLIIAITAVAANAKNQNDVMDVLAMHENLKRNHPDDALSQLGPHEFQRAYHVVKRKRGQKVSLSSFLWFFLGLFAAIPFGSYLIAMEAQFLGAMLFVVIPILLSWYGKKKASAKLPQFFDDMRTELGL